MYKDTKGTVQNKKLYMLTISFRSVRRGQTARLGLSKRRRRSSPSAASVKSRKERVIRERERERHRSRGAYISPVALDMATFLGNCKYVNGAQRYITLNEIFHKRSFSIYIYIKRNKRNVFVIKNMEREREGELLYKSESMTVAT